MHTSSENDIEAHFTQLSAESWAAYNCASFSRDNSSFGGLAISMGSRRAGLKISALYNWMD